ncbi:hypothetical protein NW768_004179 [Fusarium equiseti]|uniref:Uncharacterized protein n=1 Tax=Fusarium equiseti TaxID=61235 RepID=A0ABQ8RJZ1_FUSEQ|nr:hypothetical protein NW768_004179 [Fusarium equiseti]
MVAKTAKSVLLTVQNQDDNAGQVPIQPESVVREFQRPFWLRRTALLLFAFVFITCGISLVVLDRVITSRNGLPLTISETPYSWTYGPTAILVLILSLWRRVDYHTRASQPWHELHVGGADVTRSFLLDYITPFQAKSAFEAAKNRHFRVVSTITSFVILKLIILTSTTLFIMNKTTIAGTFDITYQDSFNATKLWKMYDPLAPTTLQVRDFLPAYKRGSADPIWTYLGRLNNVTSTEREWNPVKDIASQRFVLDPSDYDVTMLEAPVEVFTPKIICEEAKLEVTSLTAPGFSSWKDETPMKNFRFTSKSCKASAGMVNICALPKYGDPPLSEGSNSRTCVQEPQVYTVHRLNCSGFDDDLFTWIGSGNETSWLADSEPFDIRYAISAAKFNATFYGDDQSAFVTGIEMTKSNSIICQIGYAIETRDAAFDVRAKSVSFPRAPAKIRTLANLSNLAFAEMLWTNTDSPANVLVTSDRVPTIKGYSNLGSTPGAEAVLFQLMYAKLGYPKDLGVFYELSSLWNTSVSVLDAIANNMARQSILVSRRQRGSTGGLRVDNRLHMRPLAVWTMVAMFCLLAIICLMLLWLNQPTHGIPVMSGSIAGHAAILANSPSAQRIINGTGHLSLAGLTKRLEGFNFSAMADQDGRFRIAVAVAPRDSNIQELRTKERKEDRPWVPLAVRLPVILATFTAPLICIAVLELLHHILRKEKHLLVVGTQDSVFLSYMIRLVSTLVVFSVATMINNLDFTIITFAPYSSLRSGSSPAKRSILFHPLSMSPFLVLWNSLRNGQVGVASSNAATLIAAFLTIITSGLWIATETQVTNQLSTAYVSNWNLGWLNDYSQDSGATLELNLIRNRGAVTPPTIWEDLVVPRISFGNDFVNTTYQDATHCFDVMALQPVLDCSLLPQSAISTPLWKHSVERGKMGQFQPEIGTMVALDPPSIDERCSVASYQGSADLRLNVTYKMYYPIWVGEYVNIANSTAGQTDRDCPSIGIFFGTVNNTSPMGTNLTGLVCTQGINQVPVRIGYSEDPSRGQISTLQRLGKPRAIRNGTEGPRSFGYDLTNFMASSLPYLDKDDAHYQYDTFFNQLIRRPGGYRREDLLGPSNVKNLIKAVTADYCELMRHVINHNFRASDESSGDILSASNSSSTDPQTLITGSYSAKVTHLIVDPTSKLILQILLATMTGLSFIGFALVRIRETLPRDPCSIGSSMSLLAGSNLCESNTRIIPAGAEFFSASQLSDALEGWVFSLGWWHKQVLTDTSESRDSSIANQDRIPHESGIGVDERDRRFGIDVGKPDG